MSSNVYQIAVYTEVRIENFNPQSDVLDFEVGGPASRLVFIKDGPDLLVGLSYYSSPPFSTPPYLSPSCRLVNFDPSSTPFVAGSIVFADGTVYQPGTASGDSLAGTVGSDYFDFSAGGNDTVLGEPTENPYSYGDVFWGGTALTAADSLIGGAGQYDTLYLNPPTAGGQVVLAADHFSGIEKIVGLSTGGSGSLDLKLGDGVSGLQSVDAASFTSTEQLKFDAGATYASSLTLTGGAGGDALVAGASADTLVGGKGADSLGGGVGNDVLRGDAASGYETTGFGADTLSGGDGNDSLVGDFGADSLLGGAGDDTLLGDLSGDYYNYYLQLPAGATRDTLLGGVGHDSLFGGVGEDSLSGEDGDDSLYGGLEADTLSGGSGNDVFVYSLLIGGANTDRSESSPTTIDVITDFVSGSDKFSLPERVPGTTRYLVFNPDPVAFSYTGGNSGEQAGANKGDGFADVLWHYNAGQLQLELWIDINDDAQFGDADLLVHLPGGPTTLLATDFAAAFSALRGTPGNDTLSGGDEGNYGKGLEGNDALYGNAGNDTLDGGSGDDSLSGGLSYDSLFGGQGNDTLDGGSGSDYLYADYEVYSYPEPPRDGAGSRNLLYGGLGDDHLTGGAGRDTLIGGTGNVDGDPFDEMDFLDGYGGDDLLEGGGGGDNLRGGAGNDTLRGGLGGDALYGGGGADELDGDDGDDLLDGSRGNSDESALGSDTLRGGTGNDTLYASDGNSLLEGGEGQDELWGENSNYYFGSNNNTLVGGADSDTFYLLRTKGSTVTGDGAGVAAAADYFVLASSANVGAQYSGYRYTFEAGATSVEAPNVITDFQQGTDLLVTGVTNGQSYGSNIPFVFGGEAPGFTAQPGTSLTGLDPRFLTLVFFHAGTGGGAYTGLYMDSDRDGTVSASDFLLELSNTLTLTKADFSAGTFTLKTGDAGNNLDTDPPLTAGNDLAFGFGGNDNFQGLGGRDTLNGDAGNDTLVAGEDPFAGSQDVALFGGAGNDSIRGGDYADILVGGRGTDYLEGGASSDRMYAAGAADSTTFDVNVSWTYTAAEDEGARDTLIGGTGGDSLYGSDAADSLVGGPDTFPGYVYDSDYLYGGLGDDTLVGGVEGDYLYAGPGSDSLLGGEGADLLAGNRNDLYDDPAEIGDDTLSGGDGNDTLIASGGHDSLEGGAGEDSLLGINVGNRYGYLDTEGPVSRTYLSGGAGNDVLQVGNLGNGGRDTLDGGDGNDRLVLTHYGTGSESTYSRGADVTGGAGADTFEFHVLESSPLVDRDVLFDFSVADGDRLKLDVGYYSAKPLLWRGTAPAGFDATAVLSAPTVPLAAPSPAGGSFNELWTFTKSGSTYLYVDRNADGLVDPRDFLVEFRNGATLSPAAFVPGTFTIAVGTPNDDTNATPEIDPPLGDGNDIVFALAGNDSLDGLGGNDTLNGDAGNDTLLGGEGQDFAYGGAGNDSLSAGGGSFGQLAGGEGNDTLLGGDLDDTLYAEGQSDSTATAPYATDASDSRNWLVGGPGDDNLYGGHGHDTLEGGAGNDYLYGRGGSDTLLGGADNDVLQGDDIGYYAEPFAADSMDGGSGEDQLTLTGADTLMGGLGNDSFDLTGDNGLARALLTGGDGATDTALDGADFYRIYTYNNGYYYSLAALQLSPVSNPITITDFDFAHGDRLDTGLTEFMRSQGFPGDAPYRWRGEINLIGYSGSDYSLVNNGFNPDLRFNEFWTFTLPPSLVPDFLRNGLEGDPNHPSLVSWLFMDRDRDGVVETTDFLMRFENGVALSEDAFSAGTFSTLYGTAGNDPSLSGTEGDDVAYAFAGNDSMFGAGGNDLLNGDEGQDTLDGDLGADALLGGAGADCLLGGLGNDTLIGSTGSDTLEGGDEADQLYSEGASSAVSRTNLFTGNQFDLASDTNLLNGGAGNDTLYGGRGNDSLFGGGDDDRLVARSPYFDSLAGADGNDLLSGGDGNDLLLPDGGADTLDGGAGSDTVWFQPWAYIEGYTVTDFTVKAMLAEGVSAGAATVQYRLEPFYGSVGGGQDPNLAKSASYVMLGVENLKGYYGNDSLVGNSDDNLLDGGSGGFDTLRGGAGNDTLVGSYQGAVADFSDHAVGVYVDLSLAGPYSPAIAYLGAGPFQGGVAEDTLENISGLFGGIGADTLYGDSKDNLLRGGPGLDILVGGSGNDTADYGDRSQPVSITLADGFSFTSAFVDGKWDDTLDGIENLIGGSGNDSLAGNSTVNRLEGGAGNDTLRGDGGDSLVGGVGGDLFRVTFLDQGYVTVTDFGPGDRLQVVPFGTSFLPLSGTPAVGSGLGLAKGAVSYTDYGTWVQLHVGLDDTPDSDLDIALLGNFQGRTFRISSNAVVMNNSPTGEVLISGDYTVGQTLTASNTLEDADGIPGTIIYQWSANDSPVQGATGSTFKLTTAQIGTAITVTASYTDGAGTKEAVTSYGTPSVEAGNAPQAVADYLSGTEDQKLDLLPSILLANDTGGSGALKIASVSNGTGGTVSFKDGTVSFTPQANFYGDGTFSYAVSDGTTTSQTATVTVHVSPVNDAPTGSFTGTLPGGEEDIEYVVEAFDLLKGFVDVDDDALAVTDLVADRGTVTDNRDCTFTITPDENYFGPVKLAWRVSDGHGGVVGGTSPTPMSLKYGFTGGTLAAANPGLLAPATVPAALTGTGSPWTSATGTLKVLKGVGSGDSTGAIAAAGGWQTGNSFKFTLQVAAGHELDVTGLSFQEQGSNATLGNGPSNWMVLANGHLLACGSATIGSFGSHDSSNANTGTYTLASDEHLTGAVEIEIKAYGAANDDKATWRIDDFALQGAVRQFAGATTLTLGAVNDAPLGSFEGAVPGGSEDAPFTVSKATLLTGFSDADGDLLGITDPTADHAAVAFDQNGGLLITPDTDYNGDLLLAYKVIDGNGGEIQAEFKVVLAPVNDAPAGSFAGQLQDGEEDQPYTVVSDDLLTGFSDVDGDPISPTGLKADHGVVTSNGDGSYTITPAKDYNGDLLLSWQVEDGHGGSTPGEALVYLLPVNDAPIAVDDALEALQDTELQIDPSELWGNDIDVDEDQLVLIEVADGEGGTVVLNDDGTVTFTPEAGFLGQASFTYTVEDAGQETSTATVTVDVKFPNTAPVAADDSVQGTEDEALEIAPEDLLANDEDVDIPAGDFLSLVSVESGEGGTVELVEDAKGQRIVFTPDPNFNGEAFFTYTVEDQAKETSTATVTVDVAAVNDAPIVGTPLKDPSAVMGYKTFTFVLPTDLFSDPDLDDELTITVDDSAFPDWLGYEDGKGFFGTPTNRDLGTVSVSATATDLAGESVSDTFVITVAPNRDVVGTKGNDDLFGTLLADTLNGLEGNDTLEGGAGNDSLVGGIGNDTVVYVAALAAVTVDLSAGKANSTAANNAAGLGVDALMGIENAVGSRFNDALTGSSAANLLQGGDGADTLTGLEGADTLEGGAGNDTYVVRVGTSSLEDVVREAADTAQVDTLVVVKVSSSQSSGSLNLAVGDLVNVENVNASGTGTMSMTLAGNARPNNLTGNDGANSLSGLAGNDTLVGAAGNDTLDGGANNDSLNGGTGNDSISDAAGNDTYDGGTGTDIVSYGAAKAGVTVDLVAGKANSTAANDAAGVGVDTLTSIENLVGSGFNDVLKGDKNANVITGGAGADSLSAGVDSVRDTFVFLAATDSKVGASLRDKISNFSSGKQATSDVLDLRLIDANTSSKAPGDQAFKFGGSTAAANSVWFTTTGNDCLVQADVTGDKTADFEVLLLGTKTLSAENLML